MLRFRHRGFFPPFKGNGPSQLRKGPTSAEERQPGEGRWRSPEISLSALNVREIKR